ncbi:DUF2971 domain-containing protein [Leptospira interrogans]|uniref:DUF2971 domain-containing protein n=1 Tax=Leptospira interrogans serovar Bataviae TaxID=312175 RepID=A0AAP9WTP1_LEPIR|nr:DUF2971 domain-containing protein [Leptospira interrogans]QOI53402.1 DUF2971 domain-containing protein [Leptospira interrogans serovar Bataviae]
MNSKFEDFALSRLISFDSPLYKVSDLIRQYFYQGDKVYHYTNFDGLKGIIESNGFWLTESTFMNDEQELNNGPLKLQEAIKNIKDHYKGSAQIFIEALANYKLVSRLDYYISCFSKEPDSLDLWRTYSKNETGISIEFDLKDGKFPHFEGLPEYKISEVIYSDKIKLDFIHKLLIVAITEVENDLLNGINYTDWNYEDTANEVIDYISAYFILFKNESFSTENEVRITHHRSEKSGQTIYFRSSKIGLIPYIKSNELYTLDQIPDEKKELTKKLPISKIIVGPTRYFLEIKRSIGFFLHYSEYENVSVVPSNIPFRG